jgi:FtsZ-binding cell division protein ZapB
MTLEEIIAHRESPEVGALKRETGELKRNISLLSRTVTHLMNQIDVLEKRNAQLQMALDEWWNNGNPYKNVVYQALITPPAYSATPETYDVPEEHRRLGEAS